MDFILILEELGLNINVKIDKNNYIYGNWESGRFLIRKSGTESVIRILVEDENQLFCDKIMCLLKQLILSYFDKTLRITHEE